MTVHQGDLDHAVPARNPMLRMGVEHEIVSDPLVRGRTNGNGRVNGGKEYRRGK